jgi:hypothetical protein
MIRFLLASSGALFLGSIGAFFLFVPILSIATVVWMLTGLMLMFGLGVQVGTRGMPPSESIGKQTEPNPSPLLAAPIN